jgi:hypothetical protein
LAGIARRGFLKGVDRKSCTAAPPLVAQAQPIAAPVVAPTVIPDGQAAPPQ